MAFRYRDTKTKRFVSKATWARSKAQGGTRYKRERVKPRKAPPPEKRIKGITEEEEAFLPEDILEAIEEEEEEAEYTGAFDSPGSR